MGGQPGLLGETVTRMFRARCEHGAWWVLLEGEAALVESVTGECPGCGTLVLESMEPREPTPPA